MTAADVALRPGPGVLPGGVPTGTLRISPADWVPIVRLWNLRNLRTLNVSANQLECVPDGVGDLTGLHMLEQGHSVLSHLKR
ncbi:hypothetical protein GCM10008955_28020 [Deinococcus malanensis]|uniref:Leucine-rich repeat domain-containing protein n=1 Tax=Deinococcus malanensis TaxID=1706855 RepID=A0ABQ2EYC3_9DEIO|nr:hypothetical protein GCM10008955_28020 [Deinococcus malanensis]